MRNSDFDDRIRHLAAAQHGVVARRQLRALGMSAGAITRRVESGELVMMAPRVMRVAGAPVTTKTRIVAAMLEAGAEAVVSHGTAAFVWRIPGFEPTPVEVMAPRRRAKGGTYGLGIVHQPRALLRGHWIEADGMRVTTPTRTLFDLAGLPWVHPRRVERALDRMWAAGRVNNASLRRMLGDLARRGRPGITLMRELLDARCELYRPPESGAEGRFRELAESWGLHGFEPQVDIGDQDRWIGRVDFLDAAAGVVVEVDPAPFHASLLDRTHDEQRREDLRAAGLTVISVTEADLFHRPQDLRRALREALRGTRHAA